MEDKLEKQKLIDDLKQMLIVLQETQKEYRIKPEDINRFYYFDGAVATLDSVIQTIESGEYDWKTTIILPR